MTINLIKSPDNAEFPCMELDDEVCPDCEEVYEYDRGVSYCRCDEDWFFDMHGQP